MFSLVDELIPEWSAAAREEGESAPNYRLFLRYLRLGESRTLAQVAEDVGRHPTTIRRIAARWRWRHRVRVREWELDQAEADQLRQGAAAVAGQVLTGAVQQSRQLSRVATEARPDPDRIPLRDVSTGLRDMIQVAQVADGMAQAASARPRPMDPDGHATEQDAARAALVDALSSPDASTRFQAARVLVDLVRDEGAGDVDAVVALLTGATRTEAGEETARRLAARIAQPEVTAGAEDQ